MIYVKRLIKIMNNYYNEKNFIFEKKKLFLN